MEIKLNELVYVINRASLEKMPGLYNHPFSRDGMDMVGLTVALLEGFFMDRAEAEEQPEYKQVIPYIVFVAEDDQRLVYQRTGSEERLAGGYSMGLGGHVNPVDAEDCDWRADMLRNNMARELAEELELDGLTPDDLVAKADLKGVLYTADTPVNRVHLGLVHEVYVPVEDKPKFSMKSEGKNLEWVSENGLIALGDKLETWSRLVLSA